MTLEREQFLNMARKGCEMGIELRLEGSMINAWLAPPLALDAAEFPPVLLGSIHKRSVQADVGLFNEWIGLMKQSLSVCCREVFGVQPHEWQPRASGKLDWGNNT